MPSSPPYRGENGSVGAILALPIEEREEAERARASFAPTFDRLVTSNMRLTMAVGKLVRAAYVLIALDLAEHLYRLVK